MSDTPTIVCLCGSTRFMDAFRRANFEETLAGRIVLTVGGSMKSDDDLFGVMAEPARQVIKQMLDDLHKRKIDLADEVLILNIGGYIGTSTRSELEYAQAHGKRVRFWEPVGAPGIRDPDASCDGFQPSGCAYSDEGYNECETDGHYMCAKCVHRKIEVLA